MAAVLRRDGWPVNRKRVRRLMRMMGLEAIYRKPNTSRPHPDHKVYPYLLRGLVIERPNQVWCADITYMPMARGFVYLVAVMDWFSRRVLAWRLSIGMETAFCIAALQAAMDRYGRPEVFNTKSGRAVHQCGVPGRAGNPRRAGPHGRQGRVPGQHLHRATVAQTEVRGGVHQGLWRGGRRAGGHWRVADAPQRRAAASGAGSSSGPIPGSTASAAS